MGDEDDSRRDFAQGIKSLASLCRCAGPARQACCSSQAELRCFLPPGYQHNFFPEDYVDDNCAEQGEIYGLAFAVAQAAGLRHIVEIGGGSGRWAARLAAAGFGVTLLDREGPNLRAASSLLRKQGASGQQNLGWNWRAAAWDIDAEAEPSSVLVGEGDEFASPSLIIAAEVIEHLLYPQHLLSYIHRCLEDGSASFAIISTPDREAWYDRRYHLGPPYNPAHVREWNATEFLRFLSCQGLVPAALLETRGSLVAFLGLPYLGFAFADASIWHSPAVEHFLPRPKELRAHGIPEVVEDANPKRALAWRRLL